MICAREILARCPQAVIEITGRQAPAGDRLEALDALRNLSDRIAYRPVDLASLPAVEQAIRDILQSRGKLTGIIHCAGEIRDSFLLKKTAEELHGVFAPKVGGLVNLDAATRDLDLDFLLLYSSVTSAVGNVGQADYAAANGFMDGFAEHRNRLVDLGLRKGITRAIHWPLWKDGGMHVDQAAMDSLRRATGQVPMPTRTGLLAFHQALELPHARVMVMEGFLEEMERKVFQASEAPDAIVVESQAGRGGGRQLLNLAAQYLKQEFSDLLRMPAGQIGDECPLEDYGINSMLVLDLTNKLEKTFGPLSKTLFFEYQTVRQLSEYFVEAHAAKLEVLFDTQREGAADHASAAPEALPDREPARPISFRAASKARYLAANAPEAPKDLEPIAIVGLSGRYPRSYKVEDFWNNLRAGKDCIEEVPASRWDWREYFSEDRSRAGSHFSKWGGFIEGVDEFDPRFFNITAKEADKLDPQERLFLQHAWLAIEDAGYTRASLQIAKAGSLPAQVGVYAGVMYGEYQFLGAEASLSGNRTGFASSLASIANRVSYFLNLHGPSMTVDTMCSSSLTAIHLACQDLKQHATDLGIAGGVNVTIHPNKYLMLSEGQFISGAGHCQSFGEGGDGYIPGEGVGVAILKRLGDARRDGNHVYGIIRGSALGHGGKTNGYTVPNPQSQSDTIRRALRDAKVEPGQITYVEAHGTGTKLGDPIELAALAKAFGPSARSTGPCWIGSCKSNIGHCESAAGIAGLTKVLLQMKHGEIVPSLHSERLNPHIDFAATPFRVNQELRPWPQPEVNGRRGRRIAGISSFGAGGSNAHLIVEEFDGEDAAAAKDDRDRQPMALIPLSARTAEQLSRKAAELLAFLGNSKPYPLRNVAYTLQVGREAMDERVAFPVTSLAELKTRLQAFVGGQDASEGVHRGQARQNKEALSLFTEDADMSATVEKWLANGKLEKLAQLWSRGYPLDWQRLYPEAKPEFVSLPGYPFAKERYWAVEKPAHGLRKAAHALHPLLHENVSDLIHTAFASEFTGHEPYCTRVAIGGSDQPRLNGPAMLEMAVAAVMNAAGKHGGGSSLELQDMVWGNPPVLSSSAKVFITLIPESESRILFEIHGGEKEGTVYCQGAALLDGPGDPGFREPDTGRIRVDIQSKSGMDTAPCFIDPDLLEKALDAVADRIPGHRLFPNRIDRARFWEKPGKTATARIRIQSTDSEVRLDVEFLDSDGKVCCELSGLAYAIHAAASGPVTASPIPDPATEISLEFPPPGISLEIPPPVQLAEPERMFQPEGVFLTNPSLDRPMVSDSAITQPTISLSDPTAAPEMPLANPPPAAVSVAEGDEGIYWITAHASMSRDSIADLLSALGRLGKDEGLRVLVIRGASDAFLSGGLEELNLAIEAGLYRALAGFPVPVIACMDGNAYGPGLLAAMICDFMVASEDKQYGFAGCLDARSEAFTRLLEHRVGHAKARFLLKAEALPGAGYAQAGFAHKMVAGDRVKDQAGKLAAKLAAKTRESLKLLKSILGRKLAEHVEALSPVAAKTAAADGTVSVRIPPQADAESVQRELAQVSGNPGIRTLVLESEHPDFLPTPGPDRNPASIRSWQEILSRTGAEIVAHPAGDLNGYGWICAQLADEVVYPAAGRYTLADIQDTGLLQHACEVFSHRLGWSLGREIASTGRTYSGQDLQERVKALTVTGTSPALPPALPSTSVAADTIQETAATIPASDVPLGSKAVSATAYSDGVLLVRLEERESKNMFSNAFVEGLKEVFRHIDESDRYKAVVLTGFDNYFASGGTKETLLAIQEGKVKFTDDRIYHLAMACKIPVVAAIQGHAIGAGWTLGMFADLAVLSEESKYLSPYMEYGFTPGAGATLILPETLGPDLAKETLYVAEELSGQDLKERGVPIPIVPRLDTVNHALAIAHDMARLTRELLAALKSHWTAGISSQLDAAYDAELSAHEGTLVGKQIARNRIEAVFPAGEKESSPADGAARRAMPAMLQAPGEAVSREALLATMRKLLADELRMPAEELDLDTQFVDMGLDSISGVTWIRKINDAYGTSIEATRIYSHPTLKDLGAFIHREIEKVPAKDGKAVPQVRAEGMPAFQVGLADSQPVAAGRGSEDIRFPVLESWRKAGSRSSPLRGAPAPATEPIAVIGMAGQFPKSPDLDAFWKNISTGTDCVTEVRPDRWDMQRYFQKGEPAPGKTNSKWMGALEDYDRFDPAFFNISPREAVGMDPQQRLFLQSCWHAIESAGYDPKSLSGSRCGVFVGCAAGEYGSSAREYQWSAQGFTGGNMSILSARIAYFLNLQGPCLSIETACSSSLVAIATGCDSLSMGSCEMVLAGGVNVLSGPGMHVKTAQTAMLSPDGKCYTFDSRANGFVPGEGVGVVLLKRLSAAERDGDNILGVIRGWGVNQDGTTNGITAPNGDSQTRLEREVYDRFRIPVEDIQLIEAHGTGTKLGDPIEMTALKDAFRAYTAEERFCAIGSVKSNIGHCLAAAGVSGFLKVILSLQNRQLPPTIHFNRLNEHIDLGGSPFYVNSSLRDWQAKGDRPRLAAVSAFGFSGTNAHLVLSEYRAKAPAPAARREHLIPLSAKNRERLREMASALLAALRYRTEISLGDVAFTLQVGRTAMEERVGFVVDSLEGLRKALEAYISGKGDANRLEGGVQGNNEALALLQTDEDLQGAVSRWMSEGKWRKLLQVWVKGLKLDWRRLDQGMPARKLSLPGYPFARDRYWLDDTASRHGSVSLPEAAAHEPAIDTVPLARLRDGLVNTLAACLFLDPADIQDDRPFVEMGLDSVIGVEWIQQINKQFHVNLSATKIYEHPSIAQICGYLHGLLAGDGAIAAAPVNGKSGAHHDPAPLIGPEGRTPAAAPATDREESLERIRDFLIQSLSQELYLPESDIDPGKAFIEMGLDSIIGVEWVKQINRKFDLKITATRIYEHPNVAELAAHIHGVLPASPAPASPAAETREAVPATQPVQSRAPAPVRPAAKGLDKAGEKRGRTLLEKVARTPEQSESQWRSAGPSYGFALDAPTLSMDSLGFRNWEVPPVGPDEIRVQVMASAVNFPDALCVSGLYPTMPPYPFVPGFEVSGVVIGKGTNVTRFAVGDSVIAMTGGRMGGHAYQVNVPEECAIRKPAHISHEQGCSLPVAFCTAHYAYEIADLKAGEWVLVHTATGGVGLLGLQLAALRGAKIIASSSQAGKRALLRELGVEAIDYRSQFDAEVRALTQGRGADVVFNMLSGKAIQLGLNSLAPSGRYLEIAVQALKASERLDLSNLVSNQSFHSIDLRRLITGAYPGFRISGVMQDLESYLSNSSIAPIVSRIYPIHRLAEAISHVSEGGHIGKVVMSHTADRLVDATEECQQAMKRILANPRTMPAKQGRRSAARPSDTRIAVIGAAGRFPKSKDMDAFWKNLAGGENCISEVPEQRWGGRDFYGGPGIEEGKANSKWMGVLEGVDCFDPQFFNISPAEARAMDPQQRLFLQACWNSIENAGYNPQSLWGAKCGIFVGGGHGDYHQISREEQLKAEGLMGGAASILPARFSYFLNLKGPSVAMDTACSSSLVALCNACDNLVSGACDTALAGGVYVMSTPLMQIQTSQSGMLSKDGRCYTFDQRANGFVPGEAVGVVFLKRLEDAERDGDTIQAVISGWGVNQDGKTNGITAPNPESQSRLETEVYRRFGIDPEDIQMVEAHGTGTKLGDPIEVEALNTAFKGFTRKTGYCALGSVKSNIGHCMSAAGISGFLKVLLSLRHKQIPPTVNFEKLNEHIDLEDSPFFVNTRLLDWEVPPGRIRQGVVSSFGFSGTNVHVVLSEHRAKPAAAAEPAAPALIPLSARTRAQLTEMALELARHIAEEKVSLADLAYTLQVGRMPMEHRLALVVSSGQELETRLLAYARGEKVEGIHTGTAVQGKEKSKAKGAKERMAALIQDKDWRAMAEAWTRGEDLDWNRLYLGSHPRRAILPAYPFAKERYWLQTGGLEPAGADRIGRLHPLVHQNVSNLRESRHVSVFDREDSLLKDHRIRIHGMDGQVVLSGAALMEMARFAARNSFGTSVEGMDIELRNVVWLTPLILGQPAPVSIRMLDEWEEPDGRQGAGFSIASPDGDFETVHCEGEVLFSEPGQRPSLDLAKLAGRMGRDRFDAAGFYAGLARMGMPYGIAHRRVAEVKVGVDEVLAEVRMDGDPHGGPEYPPGVLDSVLQSSLCLVADLREEQQAPLPLSIDGIRFLGRFEAEMYCWSRPSREKHKLDIDVCDRNGAVLLQIIGLASRKDSGRPAPAPQDFDEGYYQDLIGRIQRRELSIMDAAGIG